jgi:hypothetical protein
LSLNLLLNPNSPNKLDRLQGELGHKADILLKRLDKLAEELEQLREELKERDRTGE